MLPLIEPHQRALLLKELPIAPPPDFFHRGTHMFSNPILCLDFDGVLHSYSSGWKGADIIPDPPVPGAMQFLVDATEAFQVSIFSSRSKDRAGVQAMRKWLRYCLGEEGFSEEIELEIDFPIVKPPAKLTIDDRALTFTGRWPSIEELMAFKPWYQRPAEPPSHDILAEIGDECRRRVVEEGCTSTVRDTHHRAARIPGMSPQKSKPGYWPLDLFSAEAARGYGCVPAEMLEEDEPLSLDEKPVLRTHEADPNGLDPHQPGAKLDAGKNRLGLVMRGFARALFEVGRVGTYGAGKYTPNGWLEVENGEERYMDAAYRHLAEDELNPFDTSAALFHLAQAAWNLLAVLELRLRALER